MTVTNSSQTRASGAQLTIPNCRSALARPYEQVSGWPNGARQPGDRGVGASLHDPLRGCDVDRFTSGRSRGPRRVSAGDVGQLLLQDFDRRVSVLPWRSKAAMTVVSVSSRSSKHAFSSAAGARR